MIHRAIPKTAPLAVLSAVLGGFVFVGNAAAESSTQASRSQEPPEVADACIARHRQAQVERSKGQLLAAHEQLRSCLLPQCSPVLREACAALLAEVERDIPSVVLAADSSEGDLLNVTVDDAGRRIAARLDGVPIRLDPGEHSLEFRAAGMVPVKKVVVLRTGDQNRRIAVRLEPVRPPASASAAVAPDAPPTKRSRLWDYSLLGAGSALGVAAIWVGASAASDYHEAEESCAPLCSKDRAGAIHTKAMIADGLLVLSVAALSYGTFRLLSTGDSPRATSVSVGPGSILARGRF